MKYQDLYEYVKTLVNRPELQGSLATSDKDKVYIALQAQHTSMQMDELVDNRYATPIRMVPEWRCQIYRTPENTPITFPGGSKSIDGSAIVASAGNTLKRVTNVWQVRTSGTRTDYVPIDRATQREIDSFQQFEANEFHNRHIPRGAYHQRWWDDGGKVYLLFPPTADIQLLFRMYQSLPFYTDNDSHDYFSDVAWEALATGAAYRTLIYIGETEDAASMKTLAEELTIRALRQDQRSSQGGVADVYRPPTAQGRRS